MNTLLPTGHGPVHHPGRYEPRLRRVIAHVYDHLDEPLDLDALAEIACLSPHHWHRIYHAMLGETLANTVKRLRLHRAAGRLAHSSMAVARVAEEAGYPNLQSFTRTFKAAFGMPPARYRAEGQHREFELGGEARDPAARFDIEVQQLAALPVLALEQRGSYMAIGRAFDLLFTRAAGLGLVRPGVRMLGVFFDDPTALPEASLRAWATLAGCVPPAGACELMQADLPSGPHAVLLHRGPYASMKAAYRWLYGEWLPHSGHEPASGPVIEEYLNSPRDTAPNDLLTRIHLPLLAQEGAA